MWVFLNDRFVEEKDAVISVFDHGFLYGDGVYETLRTYEGRIFMLPKHLGRLHRSGELIGLTIPTPAQGWPALLAEILVMNGLGGTSSRTDPKPGNAYLRITVSRGPGEIGLDPSLCPRPTVLVIAMPLTTYPVHLYEQGVGLSIVSVRRNLAAALPPQIKSLNFLNNILAKREAKNLGAFDGLMLNGEGVMAECTTSNLFYVQDGVLRTPSLACGILDGITRETVMVLGREHEIPVEEGAYPPEALLEADECFITNTTMEIMPVARVDGKQIGSGTPGPLTTQLQDLFKKNFARFLQ